MFGLFKNASSGIKVIDKVWMTKQAKMHACVEMLRINPDCLFIAWFEESFQELKNVLDVLPDKTTIILASDVHTNQAQNRMVVFAEHYPLAEIEQILFGKLMLPEVPVLTSLDEPFFQQFGGDRLAEMMMKLGVKENEIIGHPMVTKSIRRAQEAIAKRISVEQKATSQQAWFTANAK